MENTKQETYITEKIINGFLSNTIPIYWGSDSVCDYFNPDRFIHIPNHSEQAIANAVNQIKTFMNDNEKYLKTINSPIFKNKVLHRTIEEISEDIKKQIIYKYYSQCGEDVYLYNHFFKNKKNGVYIELGALDGSLYSNTKFFQEFLGWKGILIEPHPHNFELLQKNRPNNFLFNDVVSCIQEEVKYKYLVNWHSAVSGIENTLPSQIIDKYFDSENAYMRSLQQNTIYLKPKTLTEIIKSTQITYIDFLSLDVEGHEYEVLLSWDFSVPIYLILIEILGGNTEKEELCRQILIKNGYTFVEKLAHNEIYVLKQI